MRLLRQTIRNLILENKQTFRKELLGHSDWDEGANDKWSDSASDSARKRGRPLKQIWAKHVNRPWVQSLTYVHWTDEELVWDFYDACQKGYSKDEISCSAYLDRSDISINKDYGPFGFILKGHVSLLGQDMDKMYTGSREELYGLDHAEQMEKSSGMAKGVKVAAADTYILDKQDFRGIKNEALLDNWKAVALIYPTRHHDVAQQIIKFYEEDCDTVLEGIPL